MSEHSRKKSKKWIPLAVFLSLAAILMVYAGYQAVTAIMNDPNIATLTSGPDEVAISMNTGDIMASEAQPYYDDTVLQYSYYGYDVTDEAMLDYLKSASLESPAQERIAQDKIKALGLDTLTEEDKALCLQQAQEEYDYTLESMLADSSDATKTEAQNRAELIAYFESANFTMDMLSAYYEDVLVFERLFDAITADVTISDELLEAEYQLLVDADKETYENNVAYYELLTQYYGQPVYYVPEGYRGVKHILLTMPTETQQQLDTLYQELAVLEDALFVLEQSAQAEPAADSTAAPEATAQADAVSNEELTAQIEAKSAEVTAKNEEIAQLKLSLLDTMADTIAEIQTKLADGAAFDELIEQYGQDPGMMEEPAKSEGYAVHADSSTYDLDFQKGAMALENIGDISEPVISDFGVHILQYFCDIPGGAVELTETRREALRDSLLDTDKTEAYYQKVDEWFTEYEVVFHPEVIQ